MKRKRLCFVFTFLAGALFGLYAFAHYAVMNPESWAARFCQRMYRAVYPADWTTEAPPPGRVDGLPFSEVPQPPVAEAPVPAKAEEFVWVIEPIVIEPPLATEPGPRGVEESELPHALPKPTLAERTHRMPLADEPLPFAGPRPWASYLPFSWDALMQLAFRLFPKELPAAATAPARGWPWGDRGSSGEEESEKVEGFMPPLHCPYHGPYPWQYRPVEIPPHRPMMPPASDAPMSPDAGEELDDATDCAGVYENWDE